MGDRLAGAAHDPLLPRPCRPEATGEGPAYAGEYSWVTASDARTSAQVVAAGALIGEGEATEDLSLIFGDWTDKGVGVHGTADELRAFVARLAALVADL
jgi:hypothetical protein